MATSLFLLAVFSACGTYSVSGSEGKQVAPLVPPLAAAKPADLQNCSVLSQQFTFENTQITSSESVAAGTLKVGGKDVPEHCLVKGAMFKRVAVMVKTTP